MPATSPGCRDRPGACSAAVERRWARSAIRVMTVNRPYAEVMARRFGLPLPAIVMNCSYRREPPATPPRLFHEALALAADRPRRPLPGRPRPGPRHRAADRGPAARSRATSTCACSATDRSRPTLSAEARRDVHRGRLHVLPAVPPTELLDWVASADIVAMPIQPSTLNHRLTTPNKLFEAMAAGVPVVASDLPGMAPIVAETGCGVVCDPTDPAAIADAIRSIFAPARRTSGRRCAGRALAAAAGPYSWEAQVEVLLAEYGRLTGQAVVTPRAVVLVGGPAAPYSRSVRIARALAAEGYAVEIAAVAAPGLPEREVVATRPARRGRRARAGDRAPAADRRCAGYGTVGSVEAPRASGRAVPERRRPDGELRDEPGRAAVPLARRLATPFLDLRRWLLWPHAVRGWWATLAGDLAPADLYHACGSLTIAAALAARDRHPSGPPGVRPG